MARIVLETNSSGDVSLGKEKAPLLRTMNLLAQKIWSNDLFMFVIMQMVEIKNRLRVTL